MKGLYIVFISVLYVNITIAQNEILLAGSKWRIKNLEIKDSGNLIADSTYEKILKKYEATELHFSTKKCVTASWGEYKINGRYIVNKSSRVLDISFKGLETFEKGSVDKALFGSFLFYLKSYPKIFSNHLSFVMLMQIKGVEYKASFERIM
jgi:hypothetical protein